MTTTRSLASVQPLVVVQQIVISLFLISITMDSITLVKKYDFIPSLLRKHHTCTQQVLKINYTGKLDDFFEVQFIHVSAMPRITTEPESLIHLRQGSPLTLKCSATGEGSPQVYWQKLGSRDRDESTPDYAEVVIDQVTLTAAGTWVCYASDRYGTSEKSVVVIVSSELICVECESDQDGCGESMTPAQITLHSRFCTEGGENICMKVKVNALRTSWTSKNGRLEVATTKISRFCGRDIDYRWGGCWFQYGSAGESWTCACRGDSCNGADTLTSPLIFVIVLVTSSLSWSLV